MSAVAVNANAVAYRTAAAVDKSDKPRPKAVSSLSK
jgi:hypothetical protein